MRNAPDDSATRPLSERLFEARQATPRRVLAERSGFTEAQLVRLERAGPLPGEDLSRLLVVLGELEQAQAPTPEPESVAVAEVEVVDTSVMTTSADPAPIVWVTPEPAPTPVRRRRNHRYRPRPE